MEPSNENNRGLNYVQQQSDSEQDDPSYRPRPKRKRRKVDKSLECDICRKTFSHRASLEYHQNRHKGLTPFKCDKCDFKAAGPSSISKHKVVHTGQKPFACEMCSYKSARSRNLLVHILGVHKGEKHHKCDLCKFSSVNSGHVKQHVRTQHFGEYMAFSCDKCDFKTSTRLSLMNHKDIHSGELSEVTVKAELGVHDCSKCSYQAFSMPELQDHFRKDHHGELPEVVVKAELDVHDCSKCSYQASSMPELQDHFNKDHHAPGQFPCAYCHYVSRHQKELTDHLAIHSEENSFPCDYCQYRATRRDALTRHTRRMHSSEYAASSSKGQSNGPKAMKRYTCKKCGFQSNTYNDKKSHNLNKHNRHRLIITGVENPPSSSESSESEKDQSSKEKEKPARQKKRADSRTPSKSDLPSTMKTSTRGWAIKPPNNTENTEWHDISQDSRRKADKSMDMNCDVREELTNRKTPSPGHLPLKTEPGTEDLVEETSNSDCTDEFRQDRNFLHMFKHFVDDFC